jgi:hypothetical protein
MTTSDSDAMRGYFSDLGIPYPELSPEQQFAQFASTEFRPGPSRMRSAFYDVANPLLQQYYLAQPGMADYGGFRSFMDQNVALRPNWETLRGQAERAALVAGMPPAQFFEYYDPAEDPASYEGPEITPGMRAQLDAMSDAEQLMWRQMYGTGETAAANQLGLANLMALQRGGGGLYGGAMGGAISSALGELQSQLMARDPDANFLDWYLARTQGQAGQPGGFLSAPGT